MARHHLGVWNGTGQPAVSVPAGFTEDGLPLAVQLVGKPWGEAGLLATAAWCEAALGVPPRVVSGEW